MNSTGSPFQFQSSHPPAWGCHENHRPASFGGDFTWGCVAQRLHRVLREGSPNFPRENSREKKKNCEAALMGLGVGKCTQLGNWVETDVIIIFHNCPISLNISYFVS